MRAFVAGATGYTGRALVPALVRRGVITYAHVRPDSPRTQTWRERFERDGATVDMTPWQLEALTATLRRLKPDVVYSLLGTTRARAKVAAANGRDEGYEAVDYGLTIMLLRAARAAEHPPRFVYLSAIGAGNPRGEYLKVRARVEDELRRSGLDHVVARPSFITGPDRDEYRPIERILGRVSDAALALAGAVGARGVHDRWRSIGSDALAAALVRLGTDREAHGVYESDALQAAARASA